MPQVVICWIANRACFPRSCILAPFRPSKPQHKVYSQVLVVPLVEGTLTQNTLQACQLLDELTAMCTGMSSSGMMPSDHSLGPAEDQSRLKQPLVFLCGDLNTTPLSSTCQVTPAVWCQHARLQGSYKIFAHQFTIAVCISVSTVCVPAHQLLSCKTQNLALTASGNCNT